MFRFNLISMPAMDKPDSWQFLQDHMAYRVLCGVKGYG
jgi:hypothetical protein